MKLFRHNRSIRNKLVISISSIVLVFALFVSLLIVLIVSNELKQRLLSLEQERANYTLKNIDNNLHEMRNTAVNIVSNNLLYEELVNNSATYETVSTHLNNINSVNTKLLIDIFFTDVNRNIEVATSNVNYTNEQIEFAIENPYDLEFNFVRNNKLVSYIILPYLIQKKPYKEDLAYYSVTCNMYYFWENINTYHHYDNSIIFILSNKDSVVLGTDYLDENNENRKDIKLPYYDAFNIENDEKLIKYDSKSRLITDKIKNDGYDLLKYNSIEDGSETININGTKYIVIHTTSEKYKWKLIQYIPQKEFFKSSRAITMTIISGTIIFTLLSLGVAYVLSNKITSPIFSLKRLMENYELGNDDIISDLMLRNDEFKYLYDSYVAMIMRTEGLINDNYLISLNKKKVELKMIKSSIDPHFMYNILDSIYWLIRLDKKEKNLELVQAFTKYLRTMLHSQSEFITVAVQYEAIDNYCKLQNMFYNDSIRHIIDIPEELYFYSIMPLLLQPIAENAYKYAFNKSTRNKDNIIRISGEKVEDCLIFKVSDNGVGIEPDRLNDIIFNVKKFQITNDGMYFGLGSVNERIRIQYGDDYGVDIASTVGIGTTVSITFPVVSASKKLI